VRVDDLAEEAGVEGFMRTGVEQNAGDGRGERWGTAQVVRMLRRSRAASGGTREVIGLEGESSKKLIRPARSGKAAQPKET
jgi:hypothetical protein